MSCSKDHVEIKDVLKELPEDQGKRGRHKCAGCAYEKGYEDGKILKEGIDLTSILDSLEESQKVVNGGRHKSPHAAYAKGYLMGVEDYYN